MRKPSTAAAPFVTVAVALAVAAPAAAQDASSSIVGFAAESARTQQAYERAFTRGVSANVIANTSEAPVRMLNFSTPGGFEHYIRELGTLLRSGDVTSEAIGEIASRYDFRVVG